MASAEEFCGEELIDNHLGHLRTDHTGTDEINAPLSIRRAEALRDYLVGQGIDASRIVTVEGRGKSLLCGEDAYSVMARRAEAVLRK